MPRWEGKGRPKKPAVSMRGETYEKLTEQARQHGMSTQELLEFIIDCFFTDQSIQQRETSAYKDPLDHRDATF